MRSCDFNKARGYGGGCELHHRPMKILRKFETILLMLRTVPFAVNSRPELTACEAAVVSRSQTIRAADERRWLSVVIEALREAVIAKSSDI